jgi:hypothetical protein
MRGSTWARCCSACDRTHVLPFGSQRRLCDRCLAGGEMIERWRKSMAACIANTPEWVALLFCIDQAQRTYQRSHNGRYYPNATGRKVTIYRMRGIECGGESG